MADSLKVKNYKKSIFLIIDALRYDMIGNKNLYPTLSKLAKNGVFKKVVANACSTQFVLPSIFSLTYPLDNGGYNFGIRDRKSSYVEAIKKKYKKKIIMISSCNAMGIGTSFDRGFDEILTTFDFRLLIEQKINRTLLYEIQLYEKREISESKLIKIIQKEFIITLDQLDKFYQKYDKSLWPKKLKKINKFIFENSKLEKKILLQNPKAVINKIKNIPGGVYWTTLGNINYLGYKYFFEKLKTALIWRSMKLIGKQRLWPFFFLTHYQVLFSEILNKICTKISNIKKDEWHIHMHIMDLHDARSASRFFHLLGRYKFFIPWLIEKIKGKTKHRFVYASSLMYIDNCVKVLLEHLKNEKILDDTLLFITADHGSDYAESPRKKVHIGERNHYEHVDIPLIISPNLNKNVIRPICDSMGMTATLLELLKVPLDKSYKGQSIFKNGKNFVISENAGSGNADLFRKDLYFTITTVEYKLMITLSYKKLIINKLYNIAKDPKELNNLYSIKKTTTSRDVITKLISNIYLERKDLFTIKGINSLSNCLKLLKIKN